MTAPYRAAITLTRLAEAPHATRGKRVNGAEELEGGGSTCSSRGGKSPEVSADTLITVRGAVRDAYLFLGKCYLRNKTQKKEETKQVTVTQLKAVKHTHLLHKHTKMRQK